MGGLGEEGGVRPLGSPSRSNHMSNHMSNHVSSSKGGDGGGGGSDMDALGGGGGAVGAALLNAAAVRLKVCAAISLLRISEWMHAGAHMTLHSLLHGERHIETQAIALVR